jgi:hypothetical protein
MPGGTLLMDSRMQDAAADGAGQKRFMQLVRHVTATSHWMALNAILCPSQLHGNQCLLPH